MTNNALDYLANFFLSFSHSITIVPVIIVGLIWVDRSVFYNVLWLVLISMIVNFALKSTFQIPLSLSLGKTGFAFPSGHMQCAAVLYLWLALKFKNIVFRLFVVMLLIGVGLSLHYFGYHSYLDIIGAVCVAGLLVFLYNLMLSKNRLILPFVLLIIASSLMVYIYIHYGLIPRHVWMAYNMLLGAVMLNFFSKMPNNIRTH